MACQVNVKANFQSHLVIVVSVFHCTYLVFRQTDYIHSSKKLSSCPCS